MKIFLLLLFFIPNLWASSCSHKLTELLKSTHLSDQGELGSFGIWRVTSQSYARYIQRTGQFKEMNMQGLISGYFEIEIKKLTFLHPIPNPDRRGSRENLDQLKDTLDLYGFSLQYPIQVALFANGTLRIMGGHHRVRAMHDLGESHIPARVFIWTELKPEVRQMYQQTFIDPLSRKYPDLYKDLTQ